MIRIRESIPHIEVIMITGHGDVDIAVEAMKLGACDFIRKPFNLDRLDLVVEKAHQRVQLSRENAMLRHSTGQERDAVRFIGNSQVIILKLLDFHGGNRQKTADTLGISRKTLYRKLSQYAIE